MTEPETPAARPRVRMRDVAERAGVSSQTVSNVVNGRTDHVGPETIERVSQAIEDLGYRLNQSARSLRKGTTGIVGLGLPDLASEYYGELAERLARRFSARGVRLVTENTGGAVTAEAESLAASHLETYDGFILAVAASESADLNRILATKPIVLLGERALFTRFDHVLMDNVGGGRLATAHLLERGARSVAILGGSLAGGDSVQTLRTRGYIEAHEALGLPLDEALVVRSGLDAIAGHEAMANLLDRGGPKVDGLFAVTDSAAFGAMRALRERGFTIPDDVQVVGFDNLRSGAFCTPALTSIEPGNEEMADAIVDVMMARLERRRDFSDPRRVMPEARVVPRETTLAGPASP
ncbi:MAG TPA: LacI family DNA-binding transcriptional regulator [Microbacterium sp.]|nr:LacI family DNA-binding transcriptional regulator [Microbacterium sp.]